MDQQQGRPPKKGSKTSRFGTDSRISHDASDYYNAKMNAGLPPKAAEAPEPDQPFPPEFENSLILGSAEVMQQIPDRSVHLMVTSPPYNVTKEYDQDLSLDDYLLLLRRVFSETYRVLVHGGRACVNVANLGRKPYIPLSDHISRMMIEIGFKMRGEIIWSKGAGAGVSMAWGSWQSASNPVLRDTHEYILVFCKEAFQRKKIAGKENTITREQFMEWTKSVWTMNPEIGSQGGSSGPVSAGTALPPDPALHVQARDRAGSLHGQRFDHAGRVEGGAALPGLRDQPGVYPPG